jgi:acetyl esterase/lipase
MNKLIVTFAIFLLSPELLSAQVVRQRDIIYQRAEGVALTMDVFVPEKPNGIGIIKIVSGGWKSRYEKVTDGYSSPYTDHGYTVFAVFHGSQPRYKVRDIMGFMHRAVRFIRTNADRWSIDPNRIARCLTAHGSPIYCNQQLNQQTVAPLARNNPTTILKQ